MRKLTPLEESAYAQLQREGSVLLAGDELHPMAQRLLRSWFDDAVGTIREATKDLPNDMPLDERKKIVDAAYSFGSRDQWPYKMWLKARRQYLARYGYRVDTPLLDMLSPMDKAKQKAEARRG